MIFFHGASDTLLYCKNKTWESNQLQSDIQNLCVCVCVFATEIRCVDWHI